MEQIYIDYVYKLFEFLHSHPELGMEEHETSAFLAAELEDEITEASAKLYPAVILIPGVYGNTGRGMAEVHKSVERAVGSDILFGGE